MRLINNECVPNNEVLRMCSKRVNASVNVREMLHMATQEAEHSLESVVRGHHVYKYIWARCLGKRLSFRADVGNAHELYTMMFR